jgi:hypothetical protein
MRSGEAAGEGGRFTLSRETSLPCALSVPYGGGLYPVLDRANLELIPEGDEAPLTCANKTLGRIAEGYLVGE